MQEEERREEFHIVGNRCRSWFCEHCAKIQGPRLRGKLIDRVATWQSPMMLTFTIDPDLFDNPEAAFKHVSKERALAKVMHMISKYVASCGYFYVIEWQENGWPHWHVLCDSPRIPIEKVRQAWAKFVPSDRRHLVRPKIGGLGIVRFSKPGWCKSAKHAALYVSKYLTKYPENGFPSWVMQAKYRIRRYSTSRGFWGTLSHRKASHAVEHEMSASDEGVAHFPDDDDADERPKRSHAQRLHTCCTSCTVYRVASTVETIDQATGEVKTRPLRKFFRKLACHATFLAKIVRDELRDIPDLPAFVRGVFVQWRASWPGFVEFFGGEVNGSIAGEVVAMRL